MYKLWINGRLAASGESINEVLTEAEERIGRPLTRHERGRLYHKELMVGADEFSIEVPEFEFAAA